MGGENKERNIIIGMPLDLEQFKSFSGYETSKTKPHLKSMNEYLEQKDADFTIQHTYKHDKPYIIGFQLKNYSEAKIVSQREGYTMLETLDNI
jgi:hypothetical protein